MGQKCASLSDEVACVTRSQYFLLGCQTQSESGLHFVGFFFWSFFFWFLLGCQYGKPSRNLCLISWVFLLFLLFFSVSGKVLPVTPLLSGVFVHRVFCAYFVRFEGAGVIRSLLCTINL